VKSLREARAVLSDAYAHVRDGEAWLINMQVTEYPWANRWNHEPKRDRKLLLHRMEIDQLLGKTKAKGLTLVPLRLYLGQRGRAKVEIGLARGKQLHDRRRDIAERDARRQMERDIADARRR
jgi:SsrA-binding protein